MFSETNNQIFRNSRLPEFELQMDIQGDEEQILVFEEIIQILVTAGYYRSRIKGLSDFDKIIGGMTWCMESCYFDVDVDLLFQENLTIGQRISLTEKIVAVLPKMNCPFTIEPHQIQGLDCIHIFPVIQWLVKESMKTREDMAEYVRSFTITQFNKRYTFEEESLYNKCNKMKLTLNSIITVKKTYEPLRHFKQKDVISKDEFSIVSNILLEYGNMIQISQNLINKLQEQKLENPLQNEDPTKEIIERRIQEKIKVEKLMKNLFKFNDNMVYLSSNVVRKIVIIQAQEIAKAVRQYAVFMMNQNQIKDFPVNYTISTLEKQKSAFENKLLNFSNDQEKLTNNLREINEKLQHVREKQFLINTIMQKMRTLDSSENNRMLYILQKLFEVHNGLKDQENEFRERCKLDLKEFYNSIEKVLIGEPKDEINYVINYEAQKEMINQLRLKLARKNRAISTLIRQLDDVPGRSELTQYQRRFMELYNQVSVKHKETKQYYTLYNTLDDTKLYLNKELSLLNSIQDNYNKAMSSASGREQFIKQFEHIIVGVQNNKLKVEKRCTEEKNHRDALSTQLVSLMEQQRKYVVAVRQLTIECRKNESLLAQLRGP